MDVGCDSNKVAVAQGGKGNLSSSTYHPSSQGNLQSCFFIVKVVEQEVALLPITTLS